MRSERLRRIRVLLVVLTALMVGFTFTCGDVMAVSYKKQSGLALAGYKLKDYDTVKNPSWNFVKKKKYKHWYGTWYNSSQGSKVKLRTWLDVEFDNPQSITVTPDGKYMFIMNTPKGQHTKEYKRKGYIWRIDLAAMQKDSVVKQKMKRSGGTISVDASGARKPNKPYTWTEWVDKKGKKFDDLANAQREKDQAADEKNKPLYIEKSRKAAEEKAAATYDAERKVYFDQSGTEHPFYYDEDIAWRDDAGTWHYNNGEEGYFDAEKNWHSFFEFEEDGYLDSNGTYHDYSEGFVPAYNEEDKTKLYNHDPYEKGFAGWARKNSFRQKTFKETPLEDYDYVYRKYFHHSARMVTGHGQTLAYNPKTKKLWYLPNMKQKACRAVMVNPKTLKQEAIVDFKLKSSIQCPSTLTFDKRGNAYCYARTKKKKQNVPAHVAKIYKGTLSPSGAHFRLVMKGLRWAPGSTPQSIGYNPKSDRLYLVSDRSIITVPCRKILNASNPSLKASDLRAARWSFSREFEGISFDAKGNGYFLGNKPDMVMKVVKDF